MPNTAKKAGAGCPVTENGTENVPLLIIIGFCLWVWVELATLVAIGGELGVLLTIAGIFVTAMVGLSLIHI